MIDHCPDTKGVRGARRLDQYGGTPNGQWKKGHFRIPDTDISDLGRPDLQCGHGYW